eukprot:Skav214558  [mRNA]  locus=scaffold285:131928:147282:- [translate_table: standard]
MTPTGRGSGVPSVRRSATQVRLLEFETWKEALASSNPSVAATLHALLGLASPVPNATAVNLDTAAELAASRGCIGALYLRIVSASSLPKDGAPFVRAQLPGAAPQRTETSEGTKPRWDATPFVFEVRSLDCELTLTVLSGDVTGDDVVGVVTRWRGGGLVEDGDVVVRDGVMVGK